jgi:predicted metal-dependent peptidase
MSAQQKIMKARDRLLVDEFFYGSLIYSMPLVEATRVRGQAIDTMAMDGNTIWYNPAFVLRLTDGEVKGVLCHEVMHKANAHHLRRNGRDNGEWNIACDYAINPSIRAGRMQLPAGALVDEKFEKLSAEEIFELRKKQQAMGASAQKVGATPPQAGKQGSGKPGQGDSTGQKKGASAGLILEPLSEDGTSLSPAQISEKLAELQVEIVQAARAAERNGTLPAGVERIVSEARKPSVDWRDALRRYMSELSVGNDSTTWRRVNRRALAMRTYLPAHLNRGINHMVIIQDTSGSITASPHAVFIAEMERLIEDLAPQEVTILACDARVHCMETFSDGDTPTFKSPGGGGTAFQPAFNAIERAGIQPDVAIYFTDLQCWGQYQDPGYPVVWAKWGNSIFKKPAFGEIIQIK